MKFKRASIPDVIICEPKIHKDHRGYFVETFRKDKLEEFIGYTLNFCQDNESSSTFGILRGLHYQLAPYAQSKLIRVISGSVLDIAVDIRKDSPTFGKYVSIELTGENKKQFFIPKGFAHGFVVLSDEATFAYKVDAYYEPNFDRGIAYDDALLGIDWKVLNEEIQVSAKDAQQPSFLGADF